LSHQLHQLSIHLNQQGVATLLLLAQSGVITEVHSPINVTYLADLVVNLRYSEAGGTVRQALAAIKKRSGCHERTIRELQMEQGCGLRVGKALTAFGGVLTGVPRFNSDLSEMLGDSK
jgi:circadian clock protein KaiC